MNAKDEFISDQQGHDRDDRVPQRTQLQPVEHRCADQRQGKQSAGDPDKLVEEPKALISQPPRARTSSSTIGMPLRAAANPAPITVETRITRSWQ